MPLHKDLTGAELHEPKGVADQPAGRVYLSDGAGSGDWVDLGSDQLILNQFFLQSTIDDISSANSRSFFHVPVASELLRISAVLYGPITTANSTLSVYINNVLFGTNLVVPFTSSTSGTMATVTVSTPHTIPANSVVEVRSDGASDGAQPVEVSLQLRAKSV